MYYVYKSDCFRGRGQGHHGKSLILLCNVMLQCDSAKIITSNCSYLEFILITFLHSTILFYVVWVFYKYCYLILWPKSILDCSFYKHTDVSKWVFSKIHINLTMCSLVLISAVIIFYLSKEFTYREYTEIYLVKHFR